MPMNIVYGDQHFAGRLSASSMTIPSDAVGDSQVDADNPIGADKLQHQVLRTFNQSVPAAATSTIHVARGDGEIVSVRAMCRTAPASGKSYTVDVKLNGTTILTGVITINDATTILTPSDGTLATTAYVTDDIFSVVIIDVAGGTLGTDLIVAVVLREDADPT